MMIDPVRNIPMCNNFFNNALRIFDPGNNEMKVKLAVRGIFEGDKEEGPHIS